MRPQINSPLQIFGTQKKCSGQNVGLKTLLSTHLKKMLVKLDHEIPNFRGENSQNMWVATSL